MKKHSELVGALLALILVFTLTACSMGTDTQVGVVTVASLQTGGTLTGMRSVIAQGVGTSIMIKDNLAALFWVRPGEGYYFIVLDTAKNITMRNFVELTGGQATGIKSYTTFYELRDALKASGWRVGSVKDLSPVLVTAIAASSSWVAQMAGSMTTFMFIPIICDSTVGNVCGAAKPTQPTKG